MENKKQTQWIINFNPCTLKYYLYLHAGDNFIKCELDQMTYDSLNNILCLSKVQEVEHTHEREKEDKILDILKHNLYVEKGTGNFKNIEIISCSLGNQHSEDFDTIKEWLENDN